MRQTFVIYRITNLVNNKIYIGSASCYDKRIGTHKSRLRKNDHDNDHLQAAWNKYGEARFIFEVIEQADKESLLKREQYWMDKTLCCDPKIGYNMAKIAGSKVGTTMPESAKKKIGDFWRGKKFSQERITNVREARTKAQGKAIYVFDEHMNKLWEYPSISEASRRTGVSVGAISKQCSRKRWSMKKRRKDCKYIFTYKD